jgi:E3 ubiquitin-protein ligase HERC1
MGEGADDAGGVFDDTITEMCIELTNGTLPYLIPTPNSANDVGFNRDRFLLNPDLTTADDLIAFKFIGTLKTVHLLLMVLNEFICLHCLIRSKLVLFMIPFMMIGILFGVSIRTKKPVAIPFASIIWKLIVGEEVSADDLEEVDVMYIKGLQSIRDNIASQFNETNFHEVSRSRSTEHSKEATM